MHQDRHPEGTRPDKKVTQDQPKHQPGKKTIELKMKSTEKQGRDNDGKMNAAGPFLEQPDQDPPEDQFLPYRGQDSDHKQVDQETNP